MKNAKPDHLKTLTGLGNSTHYQRLWVETLDQRGIQAKRSEIVIGRWL